MLTKWATTSVRSRGGSGEFVLSATEGIEINRPDIIAEVRAAFDAYEAALTGNDIETLGRLFWTDPAVIRFGPNGTLKGPEELAAFRRGRAPADVADLARELTRVEIASYGGDFATAFAEYRRTGSGRTGQQSQTWMRTPKGWRIVAAHVSLGPVPQ